MQGPPGRTAAHRHSQPTTHSTATGDSVGLGEEQGGQQEVLGLVCPVVATEPELQGLSNRTGCLGQSYAVGTGGEQPPSGGDSTES